MVTLKKNYNSILNSLRFAFSIACLLMLTSAAANAQAPCTAVDITPPTDPALLVFEVEGKIASYNRTSRTITVNGMTFVIPTTVLVETRDLDLTGNITFETLTDPTYESQHSIIGATVIASGDITFSSASGGYCMSFSATRVFVEFAENVVVGLLSDVNVAAGTFKVNGAPVGMNPDPRFPREIIDLGGNPITLADLAGFEGTEVTVNGYFDPTQGMMCGTLIESSAIKAQPGVDGVAITRAEYRPDNREIRVEGANTRGSAGQFAASVEVFSGGMNSSGTGCVGTRLGTAPVSTVDGSWSYRQRNITQGPTQVCAKSALGGVATRAVTND